LEVVATAMVVVLDASLAMPPEFLTIDRPLEARGVEEEEDRGIKEEEVRPTPLLPRGLQLYLRALAGELRPLAVQGEVEREREREKDFGASLRSSCSSIRSRSHSMVSEGAKEGRAEEEGAAQAQEEGPQGEGKAGSEGGWGEKEGQGNSRASNPSSPSDTTVSRRNRSISLGGPLLVWISSADRPC
jgi:hypothetical protein